MPENISNLKNLKKIAIMGGTFNPIHIGHLVAAEAVRAELNPQKVLFIPSGYPPHKKESHIAYNEHRYSMCVLATVTNPYFDVSRIEIDRPGFTYTIDTIRELKKELPDDAEIYFITGADAISQILTWRDPEELFASCKFVAVTRPGYKNETLLSTIKELKSKYSLSIKFIEIPALAVSSTDIRNRVTSGKPIKYLVPEAVEDYIYKFGIYSNPDSYKPDLNMIRNKMYKSLSTQRFVHTLGVCEEAVRLADHYGEDSKNAYIAALLHDCAKDIPNKQKLELSKEYNLSIDDILEQQPDLIHSFLGAEIAKREYNITDKDVLNAIAYHTTGRKKMTKLEKIIYIADAIEPYRKSYPFLTEIKELAYTNIDDAIMLSLQSTIDYNKEKDRLIHPLSVEALKYLSKTRRT